MTRTPGVDASAERSAQVRGALAMARTAHAGQLRNGDPDMPFIDHPLAVAERLSQQGFRDAVVAAALLHDVLEHSDTQSDEIHRRFGGEVAGLVEALTEDETIEAYSPRKQEHRERVARAGADAQAIFAADKLSNVEVLRQGYAIKGESADEGLKVSLDEKLAAWDGDLAMLLAASPNKPIVERLAEELASLRRERAAEARASSP